MIKASDTLLRQNIVVRKSTFTSIHNIRGSCDTLVSVKFCSSCFCRPVVVYCVCAMFQVSGARRHCRLPGQPAGQRKWQLSNRLVPVRLQPCTGNRRERLVAAVRTVRRSSERQGQFACYKYARITCMLNFQSWKFPQAVVGTLRISFLEQHRRCTIRHFNSGVIFVANNRCVN